MASCPIVSCIVPAYNAAPYIGDCLNSILNQDFPYGEIEIIVVNDGSTDDTEEIVSSFQAKYDQIRLLNQNNLRQGAARNLGMREAKGEYISFLDSDDYFFYSNSIRRIYEVCQKNHLEYFLSDCYTSVGRDSHPNPLVAGDPLDLQFYNKDSLLQTNRLSFCVWLGLYKKSVLLEQGCFFREHVVMEDVDWYVKAIMALNDKERIGVAHFPFVAYRHNPNSTTRSGDPVRFRDNIIALNELYALITADSTLSPCARKARMEALARNVAHLPRSARIHHLAESLNSFSKMISLPLHSPMLGNLSFKEKAILRSLQVCPAFLFGLYRIAYLAKHFLHK